MKDEIKEIREYIACPQFGDDYYGKWGALRVDQRKKIKDLLDYITNLQEENESLKAFKDESEYWENQWNYLYKRYYDYKERNEKAIEYNNQVIKDTKDFYRPTFDVIYSGDTLIDIAMQNINILNGGDEEC